MNIDCMKKFVLPTTRVLSERWSIYSFGFIGSLLREMGSFMESVVLYTRIRKKKDGTLGKQRFWKRKRI